MASNLTDYPFDAAEVSNDGPSAADCLAAARVLAAYLVAGRESAHGITLADYLRDLIDSDTLLDADVTRDEMLQLARAFGIRDEV